MKAVPFLQKLGFTIHPEKSDPVPTQQVNIPRVCDRL